MSDKKFTKSEMESLQNIQNEYVNIQNQLGTIAVQKIRARAQMDDIDRYEDELQQKFLETAKTEQVFIDEITKKYGDGTFNPETGIFTPTITKK
tara:strand:- start:35 stop:316 length:282 start_codon:yes stop_codon:yes gene_type:complete